MIGLWVKLVVLMLLMSHSSYITWVGFLSWSYAGLICLYCDRVRWFICLKSVSNIIIFVIKLLFPGSDATRTKETLSVMQERVKGFLQAAVHFIPSFYSVAAMDGQTAEHLQQMICKFSSDDILTVMWVNFWVFFSCFIFLQYHRYKSLVDGHFASFFLCI